MPSLRAAQVLDVGFARVVLARETCAWAAANGLADLADTSLLERLCKAAPWLGDVVAGLIARQAQVPVGRWAGYRLRALDGTSICQPGADRTTWRLGPRSQVIPNAIGISSVQLVANGVSSYQ